MINFASIYSLIVLASIVAARIPLPLPCHNLGIADEFYYKLSRHSDPLFGVQFDSNGKLSAVQNRDAGVKFQFAQCNVSETGYIQGEPIQRGQAGVQYGHVIDVASGKCLHRDSTSLTFDLQPCPYSFNADDHYPFWFEAYQHDRFGQVIADNVRFSGYKNTSAYPAPIWFETIPSKIPFEIKTQPGATGAETKINQVVLQRPIIIRN